MAQKHILSLGKSNLYGLKAHHSTDELTYPSVADSGGVKNQKISFFMYPQFNFDAADTVNYAPAFFF